MDPIETGQGLHQRYHREGGAVLAQLAGALSGCRRRVAKRGEKTIVVRPEMVKKIMGFHWILNGISWEFDVV